MNSAFGHPLLNQFYDRTVNVRLAADTGDGKVVATVEYQLEISTTTAFLDLKPFAREVRLAELEEPQQHYEAFSTAYAPVLADRLYAHLDGGPALEFRCVRREWTVNGADLTLRCQFVFRAAATPPKTAKHVFTFEEGNYERESGMVRLALAVEPPLKLVSKDEPSAELKARDPARIGQADMDRLRKASATFTGGGAELVPPPAAEGEPTAGAISAPTAVEATSPQESAAEGQPATGNSLLDLLLDTRKGFALLLLLAVTFGAFHALTPGHGKTLVAAYLVGERGTLSHALLLGLVTTLTHTGAVLLLAAVLFAYGAHLGPRLQLLLGLGGGLLVAGMGFWLLLRRLSGQADHFHLGGRHHHHHHHHGHDHGHGGADHYHDEHGHAHPLPAGQVGLWRLIVLGVSGGIVPCTDAIVMLLIAIAKDRLDRALPLLVAFSAGLAGVLIAVGMLVVTSKRFAGSHFGEGRLFRALPLVSAALVTILGLWLCYDAVHGGIER
ncbi:MAG TPA: hypothetical protein VFA26_13010 [Gemmataceae bacterium]|nr:hypothetical protein [Gemmataceae bacterium]